MNEPADELAKARRTRLATSWMVNPLVAEIFQALLDLGGAAHRDAVVQQIAWRRGWTEASQGLRREISEAFEVHCGRAAETGAEPLMILPFGPGSHRWSLTHKVRRFADQYRTSNGDLADILATTAKPDRPAQMKLAKTGRFVRELPRAKRPASPL